MAIFIPFFILVYIIAKHPECITNPYAAKLFRHGFFFGGGKVVNNTDNYVITAISVEDNGYHFHKIKPHHKLGGWGTFIDIDGVYLDGNYNFIWNGKSYNGNKYSEDGIKIHDYQTLVVRKPKNGAIYFSVLGGRYTKNLTLLMTGRSHRRDLKED